MGANSAFLSTGSDGAVGSVCCVYWWRPKRLGFYPPVMIG